MNNEVFIRGLVDGLEKEAGALEGMKRGLQFQAAKFRRGAREFGPMSENRPGETTSAETLMAGPGAPTFGRKPGLLARVRGLGGPDAARLGGIFTGMAKSVLSGKPRTISAQPQGKAEGGTA